MIDEKKKMTAQDSSVGADDGQSISKNADISITTSKGEINDEVVNPQESLEEMYRRIQRMSDPAYLHTVTLDELMDNVFEVKSAVIENLLYTGAYGMDIYAYYFDIPFEETVRRHNTRDKKQEFGEEDMRRWWREKDFSSVFNEKIITSDIDADSIVEMIYIAINEQI